MIHAGRPSPSVYAVQLKRMRRARNGGRSIDVIDERIAAERIEGALRIKLTVVARPRRIGEVRHLTQCRRFRVGSGRKADKRGVRLRVGVSDHRTYEGVRDGTLGGARNRYRHGLSARVHRAASAVALSSKSWLRMRTATASSGLSSPKEEQYERQDNHPTNPQWPIAGDAGFEPRHGGSQCCGDPVESTGACVFADRL
jgi:hypothetical protein